MPLTDTACRAAKPAEKDYKLSDGGRMYLLVKPNGSKLWRINYVFKGRQKTLALGVYPKVTLAAARDARTRAKEKLDVGIDPAKPDEKAGGRSFKEVAREWVGKKSNGWSPRYREFVESRLETNVFAEIGDVPIGDLTPLQVLGVIQKAEARGAHEVARRCRQMIGGICRLAVAQGERDTDPAAPLVDAMEAAPRVKHRSALLLGDLPAFFKKLRAYDGTRQTALAIELVVHTFVRTGEIRFARQEEFSGAVWRIPPERMKMRKEHLVPLSQRAQKLVDDLRSIAGKSEWLVPGDSGKPISENTMLFALYRMGYHSRATIHGFRTTASTILNESNLWRGDAIERQLSHVPENQVRAAYNAALYWDERVGMMAWYSDLLLKQERPSAGADLSDLLD